MPHVHPSAARSRTPSALGCLAEIAPPGAPLPGERSPLPLYTPPLPPLLPMEGTSEK
jgi:hypothetical protein